MIAHAIPSHANIITFPVNRRDAKHRGAVRRVGTRLEFLEIAHPVTIRIFAAQVGIQRIEAMLLFPAVRDAVTDGAEIGIEHEVIEQQRAPVADKQAAGIHEHQRICLQYPAIKDEFAVPHLQRARAAHAPDGHGATVQLKDAVAVWPPPSITWEARTVPPATTTELLEPTPPAKSRRFFQTPLSTTRTLLLLELIPTVQSRLNIRPPLLITKLLRFAEAVLPMNRSPLLLH